MKIDCILNIDRKEYRGFISLNDGDLVFYRKRFLLKDDLVFRIPLKSIVDVEIKWRIFYVKATLKISTGIYIKRIILRGDKRLANFLLKIENIIR